MKGRKNAGAAERGKRKRGAPPREGREQVSTQKSCGEETEKNTQVIWGGKPWNLEEEIALAWNQDGGTCRWTCTVPKNTEEGSRSLILTEEKRGSRGIPKTKRTARRKKSPRRPHERTGA